MRTVFVVSVEEGESADGDVGSVEVGWAVDEGTMALAAALCSSEGPMAALVPSCGSEGVSAVGPGPASIVVGVAACSMDDVEVVAGAVCVSELPATVGSDNGCEMEFEAPVRASDCA